MPVSQSYNPHMDEFGKSQAENKTNYEGTIDVEYQCFEL